MLLLLLLLVVGRQHHGRHPGVRLEGREGREARVGGRGRHRRGRDGGGEVLLQGLEVVEGLHDIEHVHRSARSQRGRSEETNVVLQERGPGLVRVHDAKDLEARVRRELLGVAPAESASVRQSRPIILDGRGEREATHELVTGLRSWVLLSRMCRSAWFCASLVRRSEQARLGARRGDARGRPGRRST